MSQVIINIYILSYQVESIYLPSYSPYIDPKMYIQVFNLFFSIIRSFCKNLNLSAILDNSRNSHNSMMICICRTLGLELDMFLESLGTKSNSTPVGIARLSFNRLSQRRSNKTSLYGGSIETRSTLLFYGIFPDYDGYGR